MNFFLYITTILLFINIINCCDLSKVYYVTINGNISKSNCIDSYLVQNQYGNQLSECKEYLCENLTSSEVLFGRLLSFSHLDYLKMHNNQFTSIPKEIGYFKALTRL